MEGKLTRVQNYRVVGTNMRYWISREEIGKITWSQLVDSRHQTKIVMIENFSYITEDGLILEVTLGIGVDKFAGNDESKVLSFFKGQGKGVRWTFRNSLVKILEQGKKIEGTPTTDMQRIVVVYPYNHPVYPSPGNAIVYNADGSVHRQLKVPKLISALAKQRERFMNYEGPLKLYFDSVRWAKNGKGEVVTAVQIGFDRDWLEERELNPETGDFGDCLSSGRR